MNQSLASAVKPENLETDFNLLTIIGCAEYDRGAAEDALSELYHRHAVRLKEVGLRQGWEALGIDVDELVVRTFAKIWTRAGRFNPEKAHAKGVDEAVSLWIYKIFSNFFRTELRSISRKSAHAPEIIEIDDTLEGAGDAHGANNDDVEPEASIQESPRVAWTREWLNSLSEKDQQIMLLSLEYINPATRKFEIPREERHALADRLGLAPESIKVKRGRMIARFTNFIAEKAKTDK